MSRLEIQQRPGAAWLVSLGSLAVAVALRWLLDPVLGDSLPLVTLYGAVAAAVWAGGWRPALVVVVAGYLACAFFFIPPRGTLRFSDAAGVVGALVYVLTCGIIVAFGEAVRTAGERRNLLELERGESLSAARLLSSIVASSDDAIVSKSLDGVIKSWNQGAERLFGYTAEQAIGRHISLIIPPERITEEDEIVRKLRAGERLEHFDTVRRRSDGSSVHVSLTVSPIRDDRGVVVGASKIARDVTDRKIAEEALREADRRKTEFLAVLAHELRGPLAPLRNALAIMQARSDHPGVVDTARQTMERQINQLVRLVDDLLDISRISRDRVELRRETVELGNVIRHAVEASRPLFDAAGQNVTVLLPDRTMHLDADPARLSQVFGNLLHNAAKYTPSGGHVTLRTEPQGDSVVVRIEDDGIGIPAAHLERVFDMFTQVEGEGGHAQGGLGIGLALVKRLVTLHGGTVHAESPGPGRGSAFVVRLPVAQRSAVAAPPSTEPSSTAARRVLVVDDNVDTSASFAILLGLHGHDAREAHAGEEAIRIAGEYRPDVILLDIGLPDMSGHEVARRMRAQAWGREVVLVAVTGWGQAEDRRQSRDAGFDHHLVKPVTYEALMAVLGWSTADAKR